MDFRGRPAAAARRRAASAGPGTSGRSS